MLPETTFTQPLQGFYVAEPPARDVMRVVIGDLHSGSNYALFLDREWHGRNTSHIPRSLQIKIRAHLEKFCDEIATRRGDKKIELVHNGDAIDGDHHHSGDVCTINPLEQAEIHIELMNEIQRRIGWRRGDELYYTRGTQVHVNEMETYIGKELNAVPDGDFFVWDLLKLETNGTMSWFAHHGPNPGKGPNEGNGIRNWLKNIYFDALKDKKRSPDIVYTNHVHVPGYDVYIHREEMAFSTMHGIVCPSWQGKTAHAWRVASMSRNKIGGVYHDIKADGTITTPQFCVMDTE
jgi:hypothetical protein